MKASGTIKRIYPEQIISEKFKKREFVLTIPDGKWVQDIKFEFIQDNCALLNNFVEGDEIEIMFGLKGREWINKEGQAQYFNTLQAFGINRAGEYQPKSPAGQNSKHWSGLNGEIAQDHVDQGLENEMSEDDDLPF